MSIRITKDVQQQMQAHAKADYPNECCGFFYGSANGDTRFVEVSKKVTNSKEGDQRRRFEIDPLTYQKAEKYAAKYELDLLGVYHSHPDHPAIASEHDRKVAMPWFSYIILSVQDGETTNIKSWRLNEDHKFDEETVELEQL